MVIFSVFLFKLNFQISLGRPVLCLPGMGQCPEKSVCYFNGIDYFCCPNEDGE